MHSWAVLARRGHGLAQDLVPGLLLVELVISVVHGLGEPAPRLEAGERIGGRVIRALGLIGNNGNGNLGGGIYECTPDSGNWQTTATVTCSLVVLDQALNDRNDGLNCLPAMTGANPLAPFP